MPPAIFFFRVWGGGGGGRGEGGKKSGGKFSGKGNFFLLLQFPYRYLGSRPYLPHPPLTTHLTTSPQTPFSKNPVPFRSAQNPPPPHHTNNFGTHLSYPPPLHPLNPIPTRKRTHIPHLYPHSPFRNRKPVCRAAALFFGRGVSGGTGLGKAGGVGKGGNIYIYIKFSVFFSPVFPLLRRNRIFVSLSNPLSRSALSGSVCTAFGVLFFVARGRFGGGGGGLVWEEGGVGWVFFVFVAKRLFPLVGFSPNTIPPHAYPPPSAPLSFYPSSPS